MKVSQAFQSKLGADETLNFSTSFTRANAVTCAQVAVDDFNHSSSGGVKVFVLMVVSSVFNLLTKYPTVLNSL
jgi:hypothetical protein